MMDDGAIPLSLPILAIVDDDEAIRNALGRLVRTIGFEAVEYGSGEALLAQMEKLSPACVLTDIQMPGMTGFELAAALRRVRSDLPIAVMTAYPSLANVSTAAAAIVEYLPKPVDLERLERWLSGVVDASRDGSHGH